MTKRTRNIAMLLAAVLCFAILFSVIFIAAEYNHDCIGDGCQICCYINICEKTLKAFSSIVLMVSIFIASVLAFAFSYTNRIGKTAAHSLITLKVKLSN